MEECLVYAQPGRVALADFDAVLLDVGNVIIYDFPIELAYSYFVSEEIRLRHFTLTPTASEILEASRNPTLLMQKLGSASDWHDINHIAWMRVLENWNSLCIPIPGATEALHRLAGLRLAIVANQPQETMEVLERLGIADLFEVIILDSSLNFSKPDPAIFIYAAQRLRVQPESLIMVGDRLDNDILPARDLGMATAWIKKTPIDETLAIPLVSMEWKRHYFDCKRVAISQSLKELPQHSLETHHHYVIDSLADLTNCSAKGAEYKSQGQARSASPLEGNQL
ncbi:MAG TPA: HAD family hydrolase [Pyrinomonadaceae bacterium]